MHDKTIPNKYAALLWILLFLFLFRVIAQLLTLFFPLPLIPDFAAWHSGVLPYWALLVIQLCIVIVLVGVTSKFSQGKIIPQRRLGYVWGGAGIAYFITMLARLILGLTLLNNSNWFSHHLPTFFHLVLATFMLVVAHFHLTQVRTS